MSDRHKCIRDCYYLQRLWKIGEIIEETPGFEDAPPGKHFALLGSREAADAGKILNKTPGDDPRSTRQLMDALAEHGVTVDSSMSRKAVFNQLVALDQAKEQDAATATVHHEGGAADPELPRKPVSELSPDELETTTARQMIAMILRDRGHKASVGNSKVQYFDLDQKLAQETHGED